MLQSSKNGWWNMSDIVCCKDCIYSDQTNLAGNYAEPFNFVYCTYYKHIISIVRGCGNGKLKPKTNADRIRAMSDEELAEFICKTQFAFIPRSLGNIPISVYDGMSVLEWLKQEVET